MAFVEESRQHGELLCIRVRLGKAAGMQELVNGGMLQVLELACGEMTTATRCTGQMRLGSCMDVLLGKGGKASCGVQ